MYYTVFGILLLSFEILQANPSEIQLSSEETAKEAPCNICQELRKESTIEIAESLKEQFEEDKKDIYEALKDIENNLNEISERVWWLPKSDIMQIHNESQEIRDAVLKKSLGVKEIETKTGAIRTKIETYEAEKETNKAKAVEQWGMLFAIRQRLHNLEKVLLDVVVLAEDLAAVAHMDKLRVLANSIAKKLKEVVDYYENNTATIQAIHSGLHEVAIKKVEIQTKTIGHKKKCAFLFFFCD